MGVTGVITAPNKTELRKRAQAWQRTAREQGLDIVWGYDTNRVGKTDEGYSILLRAHS